MDSRASSREDGGSALDDKSTWGCSMARLLRGVDIVIARDDCMSFCLAWYRLILVTLSTKVACGLSISDNVFYQRNITMWGCDFWKPSVDPEHLGKVILQTTDILGVTIHGEPSSVQGCYLSMCAQCWKYFANFRN